MYRRDLLRGATGAGLGALGATRPRRARAAGIGAAGQTDAGERGGSDGGDDGLAPLASLRVDGLREAVVGPDGATVFLAVEDGFAVADVSDPSDPRLLVERRGLRPVVGEGRMESIQDVAVDGDRLLVVGPAHPGRGGPKAALLYDVSDPADPRRIAVHRTDYPIHNADLSGGHAYLTANDGEANPVEVVAMEEADGPRVVGRWSVVDAEPGWADVPAAIRPIHDVAVHRGVAYCSYWDAGTWLVDVSDPARPRTLWGVVGRSPADLASVRDRRREATELPGNHHSTAVDESGALLAVSHEAWDDDGDGAGGPGGVDLVDVSDPGSPQRRGTVEPPPTEDPSRDGVWTTAHNVELRSGHLYSAWYQGGVRVHDVSDPAAPREVASWRDASAARLWTAQVADGAVVAPSMGIRDDEAPARLYTFPDPAPEGGRGSGRVTATPGLSGFGAGAALAGLGVGTLLAWRRRGT